MLNLKPASMAPLLFTLPARAASDSATRQDVVRSLILFSVYERTLAFSRVRLLSPCVGRIFLYLYDATEHRRESLNHEGAR